MKEIEKRMEEIEKQIKEKQEEINDEIVPGSYFYDVEKVKALQNEIKEMQKEYEELDAIPTLEKVDADLEKLNEELVQVEEELEEANGSYFLTDDMKELDEQRKKLIETIKDREETKEILIELDEVEKSIKELNEEINNLSGAYYIPEDITEELKEKETRKKELEEKLKNKKVNTKSKELQEKLNTKDEKQAENQKVVVSRNDERNEEDKKGKQKENTDLRETSRWDKIRNKLTSIWKSIKKQWKKIALSLGVGASAIAPTAIPHSENITNKSEKIELKETINEKDIDVNEVIDNIKVGDMITLKKEAELFSTSNFAQPIATISNLTKSHSDLKVMATKIVGDKIHFSLAMDGNNQADLVIGRDSKLLKSGELDNLPDNLKAILGTDIGWMTKEQAKQNMKKEKVKYKTTEEVRTPVEYTTTETVYTQYARPDADRLRKPENVPHEEITTQEPYNKNKEREEIDDVLDQLIDNNEYEEALNNKVNAFKARRNRSFIEELQKDEKGNTYRKKVDNVSRKFVEDNKNEKEINADKKER